MKLIPVKFQHLQLRLRQSLPRKASTKKDSARLRIMQPWAKYFSLDASTCYLSQSVCAMIEFRYLKLFRTPTTEQYLQIVLKKKNGGGEYQLCWERCYVVVWQVKLNQSSEILCTPLKSSLVSTCRNWKGATNSCLQHYDIKNLEFQNQYKEINRKFYSNYQNSCFLAKKP